MMQGRRVVLPVLLLAAVAACGCGPHLGESYSTFVERGGEGMPEGLALEEFERERQGSGLFPERGVVVGTSAKTPAGAAALAAAAPPEAPRVNPARAERLVVYNGKVYLVVRRTDEALEQVTQLAASMDGYMQEMSENKVTVKVPAGRFNELLAEVEKLGEVAKKSIKGNDVTEEMRDLRVRLENAEGVRARLLRLLDRADRMTDAILLEKELERVTENIELLKGKIKYLEHSVAFSTLTVYLNSPTPQRRTGSRHPFPWVRMVAQWLVSGEVGSSSSYSVGRRWIAFDLPDAYVKYRQWHGSTRAMSADGIYVAVLRHENHEGGKLEFWSRLVRRELVEQKSLTVNEEKELQLVTRAAAKVFFAGREVSGKEFGYMIAVVADKRFVYTYEAWGPRDEFEKDRDVLLESVKSLRIRPWRG